jgi:excinuclease UvrABC nuclease subunit
LSCYAQHGGYIFGFFYGVIMSRQRFSNSKWRCYFPNSVNKVPEGCGCYVIFTCDHNYQNQKLIYIGSSMNIRRRLPGHEILKAARALTDDIICFKYRVVSDFYEMLDLEYALIKKLQPKANTAGK